MRRVRARLLPVAGLVALLAGLAAAPDARGQPAGDEGQRLFKDACAGCHKWHGDGGGGYGGAALSLRRTELGREQIAEVIACGRPGTGMPYHKRDAFADGSCYGLEAAELGQDLPPEANDFLRPREIEAVAAYVVANVKGKGPPDLAACEAFWGEGSRVCGKYRRKESDSAPADPAAAGAAPENDLREFRVGMVVADLPAEGYVGLACADEPARELQSWASYRTCPAGERGLRGVRFRYDEAAYPLAALDDKYEGTKVAGHPVLLTLLLGDDGRVEGLVIETDPEARLYLRKKAFLLAAQVKSRYGEEGRACRSQPPAADEVPVGGVLIKEHCEKTTGGRRLVLDQRLLRHPGQDLKDFVGATRLTILHAG
jgi:mono/diheme cytochrome c family protein